MSRQKICVGFRSGKLVIEEFSRDHVTPSGGILKYWFCRCDCGNRTEVTNRNLSSHHTRSCGCLPTKPAEHGFARKGKVHRFHMVWRNILARCQNPDNPNYPRYGGRGIKVCDRWQVFANFRDDMFSGWQVGLTVERKDNNGPYSPENCRWATRKEQCLNKRSNRYIEIMGQRLTYSQWSERTGIPQALIAWRCSKGWEPERILSTRNFSTGKVLCLRPQNIAA